MAYLGAGRLRVPCFLFPTQCLAGLQGREFMEILLGSFHYHLQNFHSISSPEQGLLCSKRMSRSLGLRLLRGISGRFPVFKLPILLAEQSYASQSKKVNTSVRSTYAVSTECSLQQDAVMIPLCNLNSLGRINGTWGSLKWLCLI